MSDKIWYYEQNGDRKGPVSVEQIEALIDADVLTAQTKVWCEQLDDWQAIHRTDLKALLPEGPIAPPPLPSKQEAAPVNPVPQFQTANTDTNTNTRQQFKANVVSNFKSLSVLKVFVLISMFPIFLFWMAAGVMIWKSGNLHKKEAWFDAVNNDQGFLVLQGVFMIAAVITFCMFVYRAAYNAQLMSNTKQDISPGWCVGWYFIPIANLWMPWKAMKQIWRSSDGSESGQTGINFWWWFAIVAAIVEVIAVEVVYGEYTSLYSSASSKAGVMNAYAFTAILSALSVMVTIELVKEIEKHQNEKLREISIS
ncbi:MAG: DUF4328 domain-containing protein [Rhodobacteraceae bacterium]|nr:DUF4328 domain-containing protein [Paracoccaceae bacterium]